LLPLIQRLLHVEEAVDLLGHGRMVDGAARTDPVDLVAQRRDAVLVALQQLFLLVARTLDDAVAHQEIAGCAEIEHREEGERHADAEHGARADVDGLDVIAARQKDAGGRSAVAVPGVDGLSRSMPRRSGRCIRHRFDLDQ